MVANDVQMPGAGEQWRRNCGLIYTVYGAVRDVDSDSTKVLYRSDLMPRFEYHSHELSSWFQSFRRVR